MEFVLLSQTCRTLYDKDYLDNMKRLEIKKRHPMIKFNNLYDYFNKVTNFQTNVKNKIQDLVNDDSLFLSLQTNVEWLNDDIPFIKKLHMFLKNELLKMTDNTESKWCGETAITSVNSVKGALKGLNLCSRVLKNNVRDMIICVIFAMFSTSDKYQSIFDKISYMECHICKKLVSNVLHMDKLICENCLKTEY